MNALVTYLFNEYHHASEARWLKKLLGVYSLYKCFYWILDFPLLFSENSIIYHRIVKLGWWRDPVFFLFNHPSAFISLVFLLLVIFSSVYVTWFKKHHRLAFLVLWFSVTNIHNAVFSTMSGGDVLYQHLLFFCIFLGNGLKTANILRNDLDMAVHNFGVAALRIQLCVVYFLAGYAKLMDADWMNGSAISDVFKVHDFSLPFLYNSENGFNVFLDYSVIAYQLLFPLLVWIRPIKKWYLLIGVIQHLFIAFVIGLPSFGFIMIISYAIFYIPFSRNEKTS